MALARLLLKHPDLLLLDEPTNHLDAESVYWLERFLQEYSGTVVAITHDRYFLDNVAQWILELDHGRGLPFEGNYSSWLEQKLARMGREEKATDARQRTLARELEWVRLSPRARQSKGKARLGAYEKLLAEASADKTNERELEIAISPGPRLGDTVIEVKDLRKAFGDKLLIDGLTFSLPKAGIVGIIGANGAGKTTLFRMIMGQEKADAGTIQIGDTVQLSYVDQSRDDLSPENRDTSTRTTLSGVRATNPTNAARPRVNSAPLDATMRPSSTGSSVSPQPPCSLGTADRSRARSFAHGLAGWSRCSLRRCRRAIQYSSGGPISVIACFGTRTRAATHPRRAHRAPRAGGRRPSPRRPAGRCVRPSGDTRPTPRTAPGAAGHGPDRDRAIGHPTAPGSAMPDSGVRASSSSR